MLELTFDSVKRPDAAAAFQARQLAVIPDALPKEIFSALQGELQQLSEAAANRPYLPGHKQGSTIGYDVLRQVAPYTTDFYHSPALRCALSYLVGTSVLEAPEHDLSSLSFLMYVRPGDHIGWHHDHNFYRGRHFTVLIPIVNVGRGDDGLSHGRLYVRENGTDTLIKTPPNWLILFEGARVYHRATAIQEGEKRLILSSTFCTDPRSSRIKRMARIMKDVAFFGPSALWRR